jgi:Resolvase, N terminal domain
MSGAIRTLPVISETLIGYARCSTDAQDLTAQRDRLRELGVAAERIYLDHGLAAARFLGPATGAGLGCLAGRAIPARRDQPAARLRR